MRRRGPETEVSDHSDATGDRANTSTKHHTSFSLLRSLAPADFCTLLNAICGTGSILCTLHHLTQDQKHSRNTLITLTLPYQHANTHMHGRSTAPSAAMTLSLLLPFLALLFDILDGRIARLMQSQSHSRVASAFGKELDSLSDVISFGVAPAVLGYVWMGCRSLLDATALCIFVACGVCRLARFNATVAEAAVDKVSTRGAVSKKYFEGAPIPSSVLLVALMAWCAWQGLVGGEGLIGSGWRYQLPTPLGGSVHLFTLLFVAMGAAMVSKNLRVRKF